MDIKNKIYARNRSLTFVLAGALAVLFMIGICLIMLSQNTSKKEQLSQLKEQLNLINAENSELEHYLNEDDESSLYERLARQRGYVYADEKVYFNVTPGA